MFKKQKDEVFLLDPGAGVGSLCAAAVEKILKQKNSPSRIHVDSYEIDPLLIKYLGLTLKECQHFCEVHEVLFRSNVLQMDFIQQGVELLRDEENLFGQPFNRYTHCIMNPPYKKIRNDSKHRKLLRSIGIGTSNLYSAFLSIAIKMLAPGGEIVTIIPRSFCNGVYFKPFRQFLLKEMSIKQIHVFDSRNQAFKDDNVLQENIILHAVKEEKQGSVSITSSVNANLSEMTLREVPFDKVVNPKDNDRFIHIATNDFDQLVLDRISQFTHSLSDLGIEVCTGPVVDFRLKEEISQKPNKRAYPLIYPGHFNGWSVKWPNEHGKKPNAIFESNKSQKWLMPKGYYVLTKRFSSKEEKRRIVASVYNPERIVGNKIGFENHLNVFHKKKGGLEPLVANGLAVYLNSTLVDLYFRQFSGHTQVNATDLRILHYPSLAVLKRLGKNVGEDLPNQNLIDSSLDKEINKMSDKKSLGTNPFDVQKKIHDALAILKAMGMPKAQQNERSALTLLALLNLKSEDEWHMASNPLIGITPIMDFARDNYGKNYAPNTRETFRRQTMHQFVDGAIAVQNPDRPTRPINSPKWVYQIEQSALELIRTFETPQWESALASYLEKRGTLADRYAKKRKMQMIPLRIKEDNELYLTPGAHSQLIKEIIEQFGPRFVPGAEVLYVGDTGAKMGYFDEEQFGELGLNFDTHGKFPDVILYIKKKNWLLLIEAVTSHGPVDAKRHSELSDLFSNAKANIIYVTAFPNSQTLSKYLADISWETEVWLADTPTHLIHFDGEKFLGPYNT